MIEDPAEGYDEFAFLEQNAQRIGLGTKGQRTVVRRDFDVGGGQMVSALVWGSSDPEIVLVHGFGQNAYTYDSVAMALGEPLIAIDMPGHGHSDWREDHNYSPVATAAALAAVIRAATKRVRLVVGMSAGGTASIRLAATEPELVPRLVLVDITPRLAERLMRTPGELGAAALVGGPTSYDSFEAMLQATAAAVPGRSIESLRTGVLHNSRQLPDGRWGWRYDQGRSASNGPGSGGAHLWVDLAAIKVPIMLVRGGDSTHNLDTNVAELQRIQPSARVEIVAGAGHSVQSDQPMRLVELIEDFLTSNP